MLTVEGLTCRYGKVTAVSDLSLEVHKGELVTLIGANGAGKTTTLKAISGLVAPAGGRLIFEGRGHHDRLCRVAFCSLASPIVPRVGASFPT